MRLAPIKSLVVAAILIASVSQMFAQRSNQGMGPLLDRAEAKQGDTIPSDLALYTEEGTRTTLAKITEGKYTVIVSGCLTCPIFHRTYSGVEAVFEDYKHNDDIQFFFMYKSLAHPELNGYVQAMTLEERLQHIVEAKRVLGTRIDWLCDGMDNAVRHTLGFGPNTQIVIDPSGKIVHTLGWSDGDVLRQQIASFVGEAPTHTRVADLNLKKEDPYLRQRSYQKGVLKKPTFSSELSPIKITPIDDARSPLYVKPRVEVESNVFEQGKGDLYLGFFLDPIHHVHWNNLAAPLKYEITASDGTVISPAEGAAPTVEQETDSDPREFALSVSSLGESGTAELAIHYFACSDEEGWCRPVTQKYTLTFERDLDGGGTNGRSFRVGNNQGRGQGPGQRRPAQSPSGGPQSQFNPQALKERIMRADTNGDGLVSKEELPEQMQRRFEQMDANRDGLVDESEIDEMLKNRPQQTGGQRGGQGRPRGPNRDI